MMNLLKTLTATMIVAAAFFCVPASHSQTANSTGVSYYRGDTGHSGYISTTTKSILSVAWQNTLPGVKLAASTPVLTDGVLYLGAGPHVYALNEKDGTIKWQYPADGTAAPANFDSPPAVADGKVFIGADNNNLSVFDANSGAQLWQVQTSGQVDAAPVVDNGTVFFDCSDGRVYAVNESDQSALWGGSFRSTGPIFSAPDLADGMLYFADTNSNLYCIKESSGERIWTYLPTGGVSAGSPVFRNSQLYVASGSHIISLFSKTASISQEYDTPAFIESPPTVSDTNVYTTASNQNIYCFTLHGALQWTTHLDDVVTVPLEITDSYLYAVTRDGVIYAIDPATGSAVWSYELLKAIVQPGDTSNINETNLPQAKTEAGILAQDGKLFAFTNDGTVTEFTSTAPDHVAPTVLSENPQPDSTVAGSNISFSAFVTDIGSGIDPTSVSLKVDGWSVPVIFEPNRSEVAVKFDTSNNAYGHARIVLPTIPDGLHAAMLEIADWHGNVVTKTWSFTVDNTKDPIGSAPPTPITPDATSSTNTGGGLGTEGAANAVTTLQSTTLTSVPGLAAGVGAGGSSGGGGGGGVASSGPAPPPGAPTSGKSAFPPPPPI